MATEQQPPALVKLLRQLSSDSREGLVSTEQKALIKQQLLSGSLMAAVVSEPQSSSGSGGASAVNDQQSTALPPPPLVPLLRQLSACAKEGLVNDSQKLAIKVSFCFCCLLR
jgi:hypothetical protein